MFGTETGCRNRTRKRNRSNWGALAVKNRSNWGPKTKRFKLVIDDHANGESRLSPSPSLQLVFQSESPTQLICPKLSQFCRRKSGGGERRLSREAGDVVAKDSELTISEVEAKKKRFQPQVVVEKIDTTALTGTFNN